MGPKLPSRYQLGDEIRANGVKGVVTAVTFGIIDGMGKVMYDVESAGRTQYRVLSDDVGPVEDKPRLTLVRTDD